MSREIEVSKVIVKKSQGTITNVIADFQTTAH